MTLRLPAALPNQQPRIVFVVSDSTGRTGQNILDAALAQFEHGPVSIKTFPEVREPQRITEIVQEAAAANALIACTLAPDMQEVLRQACAEHDVPCIDLLGSALIMLGRWLGYEPSWESGFKREDVNYFQRILALDFTLQHDDGRNPAGLRRAEIVLVGVSRVSKTPLSIYLAYRGVFAGNMPFVPGVDLPEILFQLPPEKVIGLTIRPDRLKRLREQRQIRLGMYEAGVAGAYDEIRAIRAEIQAAQKLFDDNGWYTVDMTYKNIEEAGSEILALLQENSKLT